ncbi:MAG: nucleotidyltransferase domain-containing protein [Spirochaetaceae bacterium]|nr:nucleotidyltransferase domain-containing protein [Spirochaetaceae bacterium]
MINKRIETINKKLYDVLMSDSRKIIDILNELNIDFLYQFGSSVTGREHSNSDIDLAFYSQEIYDNYKIFLLAQDLSRTLGKEIDLVQLRLANTVFQKEVLSKSLVLFEKEKSKREEYEMILLKKYTRLNEERQEILENYERRYNH